MYAMQDPSGSYDEEAFIAEAGFSGDSGDFSMPETRGGNAGATRRRGPNAIERVLTAFYRATGVGYVADKLGGNVAVCAVSWFFLIVATIAHLCRHAGMESATSASVETAATVAVYLLAGTSEFVDVSYELAVGNVNIHVLTTLAVAGTVLLGCAIEGAMLLVLFASAHFRGDEAHGSRARRLADALGDGARRGDDRGAGGGWVPGRVERAARSGEGRRVGANVFVRAGQQVSEKSRFLSPPFPSWCPAPPAAAPPPSRP